MPLTFKDIPHGATILIDANIFIYYFTAHPQFGKACDDLLDRVDRHEIGGVTSSDVLADVSHRLMTLEAADSLGWSMSGIGHRLKHNPAEVQKLVRYRGARRGFSRGYPRLAGAQPVLASGCGYQPNDGAIDQ